MPSASVNPEWYRSPIVQSLLSLNHVVVSVIDDLVMLVCDDRDALRRTGAHWHADRLGTPCILKSGSNRRGPMGQTPGPRETKSSHITAAPAATDENLHILVDDGDAWRIPPSGFSGIEQHVAA